jgi:membrane-associated phospholipid phosphatase
MAILVVSLITFVIYPVTFPRHNYPVLGNSFSDWGLTFLRTYMDAPANCLPSLHVSSCFISSLCFWSESRKKAVLLCLWSAVVSISTMTTKQHYFIDVWTAALLTSAAYWFFFYRVKLTGTGNEAGASR